MSLSNTATRIIVAVLFIPFILGLTIAGSYYFLFLAMVIGLGSFYEYAGMTKNKGTKPLLILGLSSCGAIIGNAFFHFTDYQILTLLIVFLFVMTELFRNQGSAIGNLGATFLGVLYIGFFVSSLVEVREFFHTKHYGGIMVITILASIWVCDSAAYFIGIKFGKHRLFERVSPKKSWEGAIAGFTGSIVAFTVAKLLVLEFLSYTDAVALGVIVGIFGQMGDLAESLLKRDAGVKDSSSIIPGHGGLFDRFDSLIATSPLVFLYLKFFISPLV